MIDAISIVGYATNFALVVLTLAFLISVVRVVLGPTLADRAVALDMLVAVAIGYISVIALKTGYHLYIDIAIALSLVGFLATVALARFVLTRGARVKGPQKKKSMAGGTASDDEVAE